MFFLGVSFKERTEDNYKVCVVVDLMSIRPRAIFLDFYGTVVEEDVSILAEIYRLIADSSPQDVTPGDVSSVVSSEFRKVFYNRFGERFLVQRDLEIILMTRVINQFQADLESEALCEMLYDYWSHPDLFPETRKVMAGCTLPVCLVSNTDNVDLESALKHTGLTFDYIVTSEDCRAYKPRPEMWQKALSLQGLQNNEVIHVGDSYRCDVEGPKSLGIPALWINRTGKTPGSVNIADFESHDLTTLTRIIEG
jgi:2-haloacid dehalogenase/putative hydrolase of the HAD superfamily